MKWTFTPIGQDVTFDESDFPGHHGTSSRTRGHHSLTLEGLKFENAGRYVCRVVGTAEDDALDAAAAFVVVVADPPHCRDNITGRLTYNDTVSLECSVTFVGQHNLTLEWLAPDGEVLHRAHHHWSGLSAHVARLRLDVKAGSSLRYNLSAPGYKCRAYFGNRTGAFADEASNPPEFHRNTCTVQVPAPTVSHTDAATHPQPPVPASSWSRSEVVLIVVAVLAAVLVIVLGLLLCGYLNRGKILPARRRSPPPQAEGNVSTIAENILNGAQCDSQNDGGAAAVEKAPLMVGEDEDRKPTGVSSHPSEHEDLPMSDMIRHETAANNLSDSATVTLGSDAEHSDREENMFDLRESHAADNEDQID